MTIAYVLLILNTQGDKLFTSPSPYSSLAACEAVVHGIMAFTPSGPDNPPVIGLCIPIPEH